MVGMGLYAIVLGALAGYFRGTSGFLPGIQGMAAGFLVGTVGGRRLAAGGTTPGLPARLALAAAGTALFWGGHVLGLGATLPVPAPLTWLAELATGGAEESAMGWSPHTAGGHLFKLGGLGWMFFTLLDLGFQFFCTWVGLGIGLGSDRPPRAPRQAAADSAEAATGGAPRHRVWPHDPPGIAWLVAVPLVLFALWYAAFADDIAATAAARAARGARAVASRAGGTALPGAPAGGR